jgi:quinol monooxygenase YgiN
MSLVVHIELSIDPSPLDELRAYLNPEETRRFPGCLSFTILEDVELTGRVFFIQEWESRDALEQYRAWRTANGSRAELRAFYARRAVTTYCRRRDR